MPAARIDPDWVEDALRYSDIVWDEGEISSAQQAEAPGASRALEPEDRPGEWRWVIRNENPLPGPDGAAVG